MYQINGKVNGEDKSGEVETLRQARIVAGVLPNFGVTDVKVTVNREVSLEPRKKSEKTAAKTAKK